MVAAMRPLRAMLAHLEKDEVADEQGIFALQGGVEAVYSRWPRWS